MTVQAAPAAPTPEARELELSATATLPVADVLGKLGSSDAGLSSAEASRRLGIYGPNVLAAHGVSAWSVLVRQLRSYLLLLLLVAAVVSAVVGDRTEALIIGAIMAMSIGLSFFNEYRSEKAVEELHSEIKHLAAVDRDGAPAEIAVTQLVPGDVVHLRVGDVIPADLRLLEVHELECDESVLTGESRATEKTAEAQPPGDSPLDLRSCAFMGTLVSGGGGRGVVVRTGSRTAFGAIAVRLGEQQGQTAFQQGLQDFSRLLATVTAVLAGSIFVINAALGRSILQSALFALAIAVGLTPQLLPAIVTVSLSTGARRLARKRVIVKRLVAIEDLGNVQVLFTDKTGTLTQGQISFTQALDGTGKPDDHVRVLGLACSDKTGNELDRALWDAPQAARGDTVPTPLDRLPFDHERQLASVLVDTPQGRLLISKGAPEAVLARCATVPAEAQATLDGLFASGTRVVAVASRPLADDHLDKDDEHDLSLDGFLCFTDPVKPDVKDSLARLARLGITVKIVTGDNGQVAAHLCGEVGLDPGTVVTGQEIEKLDDDALVALLPKTTIFARVTPEQKSRIILAQRSLGSDVAFLGDGVNDAIALHHADVGISVDSAADVAKDAAAVVLLDKDLGILADGVVEGRRIFANTIKYVLMGTSSNFGNMFSAAGASLFPQLPADAADADPAQQPPLRRQRDDHPDRQRRRGAARPTRQVGHPHDPPLHELLRPDLEPLRLPHLRRHAARLRRRAGPVSLRLVRRVAHDPDTRHLRHPNPPRPLLQEPPQPPAARHHPRLRRLRRRPSVHPAARPPLRLRTAPARLPRDPRRDDRHLSRARPGRRRALLQAPGRPPARPRDQRRRTTHQP